MMIDRTLWTDDAYFTYSDVPAWHCPFCGRAMLTHLEREESPVIESRADRPSRQNQPTCIEEDLSEGVFASLLRCPRSICDETVSVSGRFGETLVADQDGEPTTERRFYPAHFTPAIHVFPLPDTCPADIRRECESAFGQLWSDAPGCINHIRCAIELLLTHLGVRQPPPGQFVTLFNRINDLPPHLRAQYHDPLHALRWLGNEGSHAYGSVSREDAIDGFVVLEFLLELTFNPHANAASRIWQGINARNPRHQPPAP